MRLLFINPNTSAHLTELGARVARGVARPETEIVPATGRFGARYITSRAAAAIAGHAVLDTYAREGKGPSLIEGKTYRLWGHWIGDPDTYRTREEVDLHWRRDPIPIYENKLIEEKTLTEAAKAEIDKDARAQIDRAIAFMEKQPLMKGETALEDLYA
jgi:TPP-dependent pyruvate/acetoin dehydrogenase alpha subunit